MSGISKEARKLKDVIIRETFKDFYSNHSDTDTVKHFKLTYERLNFWIQELNLKRHIQKENLKLTLQNKYSNINEYYLNANRKRQETNILKFGVPYVQQIETIRNKGSKTKLEKYRDSNYSNREKAKKTTLERYGTTDMIHSNKVKNTMLTKYGNISYNNRDKMLLTKQKNHTLNTKRYEYKNIIFDSSWELAYYILVSDHNWNIRKNNGEFFFEYSCNNITHKYFPDFIVQPRYKDKVFESLSFVEIKGGHLINDEGILTLFGQNTTTDLLNAKLECIRKNNVFVITNKTIKYALDYVNTNYGKNYLKQFKKI